MGVPGSNLGGLMNKKPKKPVLADGVMEVWDSPDFSVRYGRAITPLRYCEIRVVVLNYQNEE
jgi:hypothetical protein